MSDKAFYNNLRWCEPTLPPERMIDLPAKKVIKHFVHDPATDSLVEVAS